MIAKELEKRGLRGTRLRIFILEAMLKKERPVSVTELLGSASKRGINPHKTSVYRHLFTMKEKGLVREVFFPGERMKRYEINPETHRHHFFCTSCGDIENVDSENELADFERRINQKRNFKILGHSLEFFGLCGKCNH